LTKHQRYNRSLKGRARNRAYDHSEKGTARRRRYNASDAGRRADERYESSARRAAVRSHARRLGVPLRVFEEIGWSPLAHEHGGAFRRAEAL
jgi:hypothetical protein